MRILDLGCGRGWLTHIASAYGTCTGVDPVAPVIEFARGQFPGLTFQVGTAGGDLLDAGAAGTFDLVIASEVIEHAGQGARGPVRRGHPLAPRPGWPGARHDGPRRDLRALAAHGRLAPAREHWLTESELRELFERHGFRVSGFDRAYYGHAAPVAGASAAGVAARRAGGHGALRQRWLLEGMHFLAAGCQLWLFTRDG
jgi:SAM-dependent methyltransferase